MNYSELGSTHSRLYNDVNTLIIPGFIVSRGGGGVRGCYIIFRRHFVWIWESLPPLPPPPPPLHPAGRVHKLLCDRPLTWARATWQAHVCTRPCCSGAAIKGAAPEVRDQNTEAQPETHLLHRGRTRTTLRDMDPCECSKSQYLYSSLFSESLFLCYFLIFRPSVIAHEANPFCHVPSLFSWNLQLRRILHLQELLLHHLQQE